MFPRPVTWLPSGTTRQNLHADGRLSQGRRGAAGNRRVAPAPQSCLPARSIISPARSLCVHPKRTENALSCRQPNNVEELAIGSSTVRSLDNSGNEVISGKITAASYQETLTTPASSSAPCMPGQFTDDSNYHYVCVAKNHWKRTVLSSF